MDGCLIARLKNGVQVVAVLLALYALLWIFGEHGHIYSVEDAKLSGTDWTCAPGQDGPFDGKAEGRKNPVCRDPIRQCPSLWFPYASVVLALTETLLGAPGQKTTSTSYNR
jgi:hypothetical protein